MNTPMELPNFNHLEVYESYDEPCLFSYQGTLGQVYLAVLVDEDEDHKKWLHVQISPDRFNLIKAGQIDLHDTFKMAESGFCYLVTTPLSCFENGVVGRIDCKEIAEDMLPLPGEFLAVPRKPADEPLTNIKLSLLRALQQSVSGQRIPLAEMWDGFQ